MNRNCNIISGLSASGNTGEYVNLVLPNMFRLPILLYFIFISASGIGQVRRVVTYLNAGKKYQETLVYRVNGLDTLSLDYFSKDGDWILSIDYNTKMVYSSSRRDLPMSYFRFAQQVDKHVKMVFGPRGDVVYSEYVKQNRHGKYWALEAGELVLYGNYRDDNRWWLWYDCTRLPPFKCGYYVCLGRGHLSNREVIYTIPESLVLMFYLLSFPGCLLISVMLARRWRQALFWLGLAVYVACILLALPMPDKNWIPRVAVVFAFYALLFYLATRLLRGHNSSVFKVLATLVVLLQLLITWIIYLLATTNFSH
ncbi:MAG: hypothetical protein JNK73_04130 [Bacteroidia bacterium]|nr:hypothetical protein [Bacteroidia bacterium]